MGPGTRVLNLVFLEYIAWSMLPRGVSSHASVCRAELVSRDAQSVRYDGDTIMSDVFQVPRQSRCNVDVELWLE